MDKETAGDWAFVKAAAASLENYLLSPQLYWPLSLSSGRSASGGIDRLTIGNLLLIMKRLEALPQAQPGELEALARQMHQVQQRWPANWSRKVGQEFTARLRLWQDYLNELFSDVSGYASGYANAVRWRTILLLIQDDVENPGAGQASLLAVLDRQLKAAAAPGPFVWDAQVQPAFPPGCYWFLYLSFKQD